MARLGMGVSLDGTDLYTEYGADLIEYTPPTGEVEADFTKTVGRHAFKRFRHDVPLRKMTLSFYVQWNLQEVLEEHVSGLISLARRASVLSFNDDTSYWYSCILLSYEDTFTGVDNVRKVDLTFGVIKYGTQRGPYNLPAGQTTTIHNAGTDESGLLATITFNQSGTGITVLGCTFGSVSAGDVYIVDGINGSVTKNGANAVWNVTFPRFPMIQPGYNEIEMPSEASATISWYPIFA